MHRLLFVALTMLGAMVVADSKAEAQFGGFCRRSCGFGGYYGPGPVVYGYGGYVPFGYPAYGFSGVSFGGLNVGMMTVGPYPYPAAPVFPSYPMGYTYIASPPPVFVQPQPVIIEPVNIEPGPFNNPVINEWMPRQDAGNVQNAPFAQPAQPVAVQPAPQRQGLAARVLLRPSTLEGRRRSIRAMALGDEAIRAQNWAQAYIKFKEASTAASDQAEPHFRMALTLTMMNRFGLAADALKRGLEMNPGWPASATLLDEFLGVRNQLAKQVMLEQVTRWVRDDIRDPDRLFLAGVLLYLDQDINRATTFLKTADQLAGSPAYVQAFLNVQPVSGQQNDQPVVPAEQRLPAAVPPDARPPVANPPQPIPGDAGPDLVAPEQIPAAAPPKRVAPDRLPGSIPQFPQSAPTARPPAARPVNPVLPQSTPEESSDRVVPVFPAPKRAAAGVLEEEPRQGPRLLAPEDELSAPQPVASRVRFESVPAPRNTAVIFRGRQRYEFFPRPRRQPDADSPTIVEDVFSR